ncbi:hypothetical protein [Streptomyces sp. NPDC050704]
MSRAAGTWELSVRTDRVFARRGCPKWGVHLFGTAIDASPFRRCE